MLRWLISLLNAWWDARVARRDAKLNAEWEVKKAVPLDMKLRPAPRETVDGLQEIEPDDPWGTESQRLETEVRTARANRK